jgi:hypothetical protein
MTKTKTVYWDAARVAANKAIDADTVNALLADDRTLLWVALNRLVNAILKRGGNLSDLEELLDEAVDVLADTKPILKKEK